MGCIYDIFIYLYDIYVFTYIRQTFVWMYVYLCICFNIFIYTWLGGGTLSGAAAADKGGEALAKDWCYKI